MCCLGGFCTPLLEWLSGVSGFSGGQCPPAVGGAGFAFLGTWTKVWTCGTWLWRVRENAENIASIQRFFSIVKLLKYSYYIYILLKTKLVVASHAKQLKQPTSEPSYFFFHSEDQHHQRSRGWWKKLEKTALWRKENNERRELRWTKKFEWKHRRGGKNKWGRGNPIQKKRNNIQQTGEEPFAVFFAFWVSNIILTTTSITYRLWMSQYRLVAMNYSHCIHFICTLFSQIIH